LFIVLLILITVIISCVDYRKVVKSFKVPAKCVHEVQSQLERLIQRIKHDDLVDIEGVFSAEDTVYMVFTYCEVRDYINLYSTVDANELIVLLVAM